MRNPYLIIEERGGMLSIRALQQFVKADGALNEPIYSILDAAFGHDLTALETPYPITPEQVGQLREKAPKFFDNGLIQEIEVVETESPIAPLPPPPEPQPEPGYIHLGLTDCETLPELATKIEEVLEQQASEIAEVKKSVTTGLELSQVTHDSLQNLQRTTATDLQALETQLQSLRRASQQS